MTVKVGYLLVCPHSDLVQTVYKSLLVLAPDKMSAHSSIGVSYIMPSCPDKPFLIYL